MPWLNYKNIAISFVHKRGPNAIRRTCNKTHYFLIQPKSSVCVVRVFVEHSSRLKSEGHIGELLPYFKQDAKNCRSYSMTITHVRSITILAAVQVPHLTFFRCKRSLKINRKQVFLILPYFDDYLPAAMLVANEELIDVFEFIPVESWLVSVPLYKFER